MWQGQLDCPVNESSSISSCGECVDAGNVTDSIPTDCSPVTIQCAHTVPYGSLRLIQGTESPLDVLEGRLEIFKNGLWGTVCSDTFDMLAANISCRQLGFVRALRIDNSTDAGFGTGTGPVLLTGFECSEGTQTLVQCPTVTLEECDHSQDVAIFCTDFMPVSPPNNTVAPPTMDRGLKISTPTFIGIMVGSCLLLLLCCICCAVCSIHFYLVPYDTKKENHGLYFIEREGSMEAETSLDQKAAEMESGTLPGTDGIVGKTLDEEFVSRDSQPKRKKNKYVPLDTSRGSLVPQSVTSPSEVSNSSAPQSPQGNESSSSVPQPTDSSVPMPEAQSPRSPVPLEHQSRSCKVSVHSLNLPGTPQIPHPPKSLPNYDPPNPAHSRGSLDSVLTTTTSLASFQASQASLSGTAGPIPTSIPIPPALMRQMEQSKARVSLERTSFGDDFDKDERYNRASSADRYESDPSLADQWEMYDRYHSTDFMIQHSPATSAQATPTKSIIKSSPKFKSSKPHQQSMPQLDGDAAARRDSLTTTTPGEAPREGDQTQSTDSMETRHAHNQHHVSFLLD